MTTTVNHQLVYSLYISKDDIDNSLLTTFKGRLYADTYKKYKQIHNIDPSIKILTDKKKKYAAINPLEKPLPISLSRGVIIVLPIEFLLNPVKLDLRNVLKPDNTIDDDKTKEKLDKINILGYIYLQFDIDRNIICLHDLYLSELLLSAPVPTNITPYLDSVIQSNFLSLKSDQLYYGLQDVLNIRESTPYPSPDVSYEISGQEDQYKLWGKIIMESIINSLVLFPYAATIWVGIDINDVKIKNWFDIMVHILLYNGFSNPYFATRNPFAEDYNYKVVGLTKKNDIKFVTSKQITEEYNEILYLFNQNIINCRTRSLKLCNCNLTVSFDKETILWLLRLPFNTQTINIKPDGSVNVSQKEFSGSFKIKNIHCQKSLVLGNLYNYINNKGEIEKVYIYSIDKNKITVLPESKFIEKGNSAIPNYLIIIDKSQIREECNYVDNNFICNLELDKRSVNSEGIRNTNINNLIENIRSEYKDLNNETIKTIRKTLNVIRENTKSAKDSKFYKMISTSEDENQIKALNRQANNKNKIIYNKIDSKVKEVENNIKKIVKDTEDKIASLFDTLVKNNISDLNYLLSGKENSVTAVHGLITFHTHPYAIYLENKWTIAIASGADFASFLNYSLFNVIGSVVITVEGLYFLSLNSKLTTETMREKIYNAVNNANLCKKVKYYFEFYNRFRTPQEFCDHVNVLKFDDKDFCEKFNKDLDIFNNPTEFLIGEFVLYNGYNAIIITIDTGSDGKKIFEIKDINNNKINVSEDQIIKNTDYYDKLIKNIDLYEKQEQQKELEFLYGFFSDPLFNCQFKTWQELLDENTFTFSYFQTRGQCIMNHETSNIIYELYTSDGIDFYNYNDSKISSKFSATIAPISSGAPVVIKKESEETDEENVNISSPKNILNVSNISEISPVKSLNTSFDTDTF